MEISAGKKTLVAVLANAAELGPGRMEETIGKAKLRDAAIGTGIAVDKMLALAGQTPAGVNVNIVNIPMPTPEQNEAPSEAEQTAAITRSTLLNLPVTFSQKSRKAPVCKSST